MSPEAQYAPIAIVSFVIFSLIPTIPLVFVLGFKSVYTPITAVGLAISLITISKHYYVIDKQHASD